MLLNNSRSEPPATPQTPSKPIASTGYLTPQTGTRARQQSPEVKTSYTPLESSAPVRASALELTAATVVQSTTQSSTQDDSEEEFYDWPPTDDEELSKAVDSASSQTAMPPPETPRKAVKTDILSTPGKRRFEEMSSIDPAALPTPISAKAEDDVFATPAMNGKGLNLFSTDTTPQDSPTPVRFKYVPATCGSDFSLANDILTTLSNANISLPSSVRHDIRNICYKQIMYTHGIIRGRDVSRSLVAKKDEKIVELQGSIEALQAERETSRAVIRHLRKELGNIKPNGR